MTESVTITTGARLHFGLLVQGKPDRRTYGGAGVMIDEPRFTVTVRKADSTTIRASPETIVRLERFLPQCRPAGAEFPVQIVVNREIPAHAGLGSGTQLGLALATAMSRLSGEKPQSVFELAERAGRSRRSVIGTIGFAAGGLMAHGELARDGSLVQRVHRVDFPSDWRFVLVTPPDHRGLSGDSEKHAFLELPPMSKACLRDLAAMQQELIDALDNLEFDRFSRRLYDFGEMVGKYYLRIQQGIFASPRMAQLAEQLRRDRVFGVGQTSWGPTLFAACESSDEARALVQRIQQSEWGDCDVRAIAALNRGAILESR